MMKEELRKACEGPLPFTVFTPVENFATPYINKLPEVVAIVSHDIEHEFYDDPDIQMVLFEKAEDAIELIKLAKPTELCKNEYPEALCYAIFKVEEGWLVTWVDEALEWGGDLIPNPHFPKSKEHTELFQKAISSYEDCHCYSNIFAQNSKEVEELLIERGYIDSSNEKELNLWISIITQLVA